MGTVRIRAILAIALLVAACGGGAAAAGSGLITFSQPSYSCAPDPVRPAGYTAPRAQFVYTAHLTDKVGGLRATLVFASKQAGGTEMSVDQEDIPVTNPDFNLLSSTGVPVSTFCAPPFGVGDYIMRIVRPSDSKVLAEGSFTIAP